MDIPSTPTDIAELITSLGERIASEDRIICAAEARRTGLLADAAHIADVTALTMMPIGTTPARAQELARRSLHLELAAITHTPERTIQQRIQESETLVHELPATLAALASGALSIAHARVIVDQLSSVDAPDRGAFEALILPIAKTHTAAHVRQSARKLREKLHPETSASRHRSANLERRVEFTPALDGMAWLSVLATAPVALAIQDRLTGLAREARHVGDTRTTPQLEADAAATLLMHGTTARGENDLPDWFIPGMLDITHTIVPTVHLTVPVLTMLGHDDAPAGLDGYGPIDHETATRLAANAPSFIRILTHPHTGSVLSVGRDRYAPPPDLKRMLAVRDAHCRAPGCNRAANRCDIDHTVAWAAGGSTSAGNLAHLCPGHHHLKHETGWTVQHSDNGLLTWTTPSGRQHTTIPDPPDWQPLPRADPPPDRSAAAASPGAPFGP